MASEDIISLSSFSLKDMDFTEQWVVSGLVSYFLYPYFLEDRTCKIYFIIIIFKRGLNS